MMDPVLQLENVESGYGEVQVLWGISLEVARENFTAIIGTNGAGKTTSLRTIMGSLRAWKGRVLLHGEDITRLSPHAKANRGLVLVPEGRQLFPDMSVEENLEMGGYSRRARKREKQNLERVYELFPRLKERRKQKSSTLSGGEQQRDGAKYTEQRGRNSLGKQRGADVFFEWRHRERARTWLHQGRLAPHGRDLVARRPGRADEEGGPELATMLLAKRQIDVRSGRFGQGAILAVLHQSHDGDPVPGAADS